MAALDSTSTRDEILAVLHDNQSYDLNNSVAEAQLYIVASRALLALDHTPAKVSQGGRQGGAVELDLSVPVALMKNAEQWLATRNPANAGLYGPIHADTSELRG